jgi:hypothetical protein
MQAAAIIIIVIPTVFWELARIKQGQSRTERYRHLHRHSNSFWGLPNPSKDNQLRVRTGMSSPLAATSLATSTALSFALKRLSAFSRARCCMPEQGTRLHHVPCQRIQMW